MASIIPQIIEPDEQLPRDLIALRKLAWTLDAAIPIPGTRRRVGLAPAIGLIPGVGDIVGAALSIWIVVGALRHRVPGRRVARMVVNIVTDLLIGSIPVIGDIFDVLFQENLGNVELLMNHRDRRRPPRTVGEIIGMVLLVVAILAVAAVAAMVIAIGSILLLLALLL